MLRSILTISLIYCTTATALSQPLEIPSSPAQSTILTPKSGWPAPNQFPDYGHDLQIVTLGRPGVRQRCNPREISADFIACIDSHDAHRLFRKDEIAAIIDPRYHGDLYLGLVFAGVVAASLGGSFFVSLGWSIVLRFLSGYELFAMGWVVGSGRDHNHDILLYQRPDTPLTIHLRAR